jgi:hypothetical protein
LRTFFAVPSLAYFLSDNRNGLTDFSFWCPS